MKRCLFVAALLTAAALTPTTSAASAKNCGVELVSHQGKGTSRSANTLGAFRAAMRKHATWIETDVFQTKNRVPLLIHQDQLYSSTGRRGLVSRLTSQQIRRGWRTHDGSAIPRLGEALRAVKARRGAKMLIEVKRLQPWGPIERTIISNGMVKRVWIYSSSASHMRSLHRVAPRIQIGLKAKTGDRVVEIAELATVVTQAPSGLTRKRVRQLHNHGVTVIARRGGSWKALARADVDGILTNTPALFARWCRL